MDDTSEEMGEAVIRWTVWPTGMSEGSFSPEGVPFAASAAEGILRCAAYTAKHDKDCPQWLRDGYERLRDDAMVLAQRISPVGRIPEPTGELGARLAEARRLHEADKTGA